MSLGSLTLNSTAGLNGLPTGTSLQVDPNPGLTEGTWGIFGPPPKPSSAKPPKPVTGANGKPPKAPIEPDRITPYRPTVPPAPEELTASANGDSYYCVRDQTYQGYPHYDSALKPARIDNGRTTVFTLTIGPDYHESELPTTKQVNDTGYGVQYNAFPYDYDESREAKLSAIAIRVHYRYSYSQLIEPPTLGIAASDDPTGINNPFTCVYGDGEGNIFVGTHRGLLVRPKGADSFSMVWPNVRVNQITDVRLSAGNTKTLIAVCDRGVVLAGNMIVKTPYWLNVRPALLRDGTRKTRRAGNNILSIASSGLNILLLEGGGNVLRPDNEGGALFLRATAVITGGVE